MRIEDHLRRTAECLPAKTALVAGERRMSYAELDDLSDRLAAGLAANAISPGDRIALLLDNGWEAAVSLFAIFKAGAVAVPLNPAMKAPRLAGIVARVEPRAVIAQARLESLFRQAAGEAAAAAMLCVSVRTGDGDPIPGWLDFRSLISGSSSRPAPRCRADDALALLLHTSGSTGAPKGVMLSHANISAACRSIVAYLENTSDDVMLSVLPLSFGYGMTQLVTAAISGATLILEKSFAFPHVIMRRLVEERVTGFPLVPTMAAILLQMKDLAPGSVPSLRYITSAAAQLPPALSAGLSGLFPATQIFAMYGQTECLRATCLPPAELAANPSAVGRAIPGTEVAVVDIDGRPLPPGNVGELVVRGPHVMQGYWRDEAASAAALRDAPPPWGRELRTGDLFRMDEAGNFHFIGRRDDIIKTRGEKVSPQEVERVLYALDGVVEAAVTGLPDAILGQAVKAVIVRDAGSNIDAKHVQRHCARHLEDYMVPKWVEFCDSLPKTDSGKIRLVKQQETTGEIA
ncbi:acyl--CoA ligase [Rhizobiaceae bacterium n13]|uniref:Acyl--CoA ligase n=1 Tax=Ferirhizobium litorale TaxID=2927786 RepID=A0AAE3Q9S5_9HYPH|nr:class I adenylate-forming enzyme family protein [Fererhizobium litorale]MDI7861831.1 acyl--CoA ligase [Fererhizobium litorale]MDI7921827.1 acyl--CoA ligase [Fererhizobium litorale]